MSQGLFYKAKNGEFYPCKIEIKKIEDVGQALIFTVYNFNREDDELNEFIYSLKETFNVDIFFCNDDLKWKIFEAFEKSKDKKNFEYVDVFGNTFTYDDSNKKWIKHFKEKNN